MCEYSNDANSSLDCLDVIDDLIFVDRTRERALQTKSNSATATTFDNNKINDKTQVGLGVKQEPSVGGWEQSRLEGGEQRKEAPNLTAAAVGSAICERVKFSPRDRGPNLASGTAVPPSAGQMSHRNDSLITCLLITANVGTIFEESTLLELWFHQLKSYLSKIRPQLVAIHCQEVGGKNFETSMKNVSNFTDKILDDQTIVSEYSRVRIFLDENFECLEKFTALGSLYLVHDSVDDVRLFNFKTAQYDVVDGRKIFAVSDHNDSTSPETSRPETTGQKFQQERRLAEHVEKVKFPLSLFPECRWSRKGFMRTRWLINEGKPLDLVNIHLFHDASNLVAMKATPSPYAQNRQKALEYALEWLSQPVKLTVNNNISNDATPQTASQRDRNQVPMFIFGDFNFRLDTNKVVQRITEGAAPVIKRSADSNEVLQFVYHRKTSSSSVAKAACNHAVESQANATAKAQDECDGPGEAPERAADDERGNCTNHIEQEDGGGVVMTVGKKLFDCENLDEMFGATKNTEWLLELDTELDSFKSKLHEFKISFSPSYPFKEDETGGHSYMKTRCPAWCDRILFNAAGNRIVRGSESLVRKVTAEEDGKAQRDGTRHAGDKSANLDSEMKIDGGVGCGGLSAGGRGDVIYRLMGNSVPMGDHKPVLLYCYLDLNKQQQQNPSPADQLVRTTECVQAVTSNTTSSGSSEAPPSGSLVESKAM